MDKFTNDFEYFWNLIENGENFTFSRYADGEVMLMRGQPVLEFTQAYTVDKWKSPAILTKVGKELLDSLNHTEENYYYAISGLNDNINDYNIYKKSLIDHISNNTNINVLYCKFYCKNNTYLGCGELTVDTLEGLNIILSDTHKKFEFDTFTGNFYKYNKK
jgi:hypothetical protein